MLRSHGWYADLHGSNYSSWYPRSHLPPTLEASFPAYVLSPGFAELVVDPHARGRGAMYTRRSGPGRSGGCLVTREILRRGDLYEVQHPRPRVATGAGGWGSEAKTEKPSDKT